MATTLAVVHNSDLETVGLIWLDASAKTSTENIEVQKKLQSITHHFKVFDNIHACEQYIKEKSKYDRIFLIVSGGLGKDIVPRIHNYRQIYAIYVYCQDKQRHEQWAKDFSKIKDVITKLDELISKIQLDYSKRMQLKLDEPLAINITKFNDLSDDFFHSQLFIDCLLNMKTLAKDKSELIHLCKNTNEISIIQEFEQKYTSNQAIWWYTRQSFLNRILNKTLCVKNLDLLFLFGFFIRDIQENLQKNKCKSSVQVYHGQIMSRDEFDILRNSVQDYISINTFFLANYDRKQILSNFNEYSSTTIDIVRVLFEITADPNVDDSKPFANITPFAYISQEQQILFMLGSIFQLIAINYDKKDDIWIIKLNLTTIKKTYDPTNLLSCALIFQDRKKFDYAEKLFTRLVQELPSNHPDLSQCYHSLATVTFLQNKYNLSLKWYQELIKSLPSTDPHLGDAYYSIGCVHQKLSHYTQALENYHQALKIWNKDESIQMGQCFNNMGCIYEIEKSYSQALEYHKKALAIREKYHNDLASSYNNIGNIHLCLGEYDAALDNYTYAYELKSQKEDPSLGQTLRNIALVYEYNKNFQEASKYYEQAAVLFQQIYPSTHVFNVDIQHDIERVAIEDQKNSRF